MTLQQLRETVPASHEVEWDDDEDQSPIRIKLISTKKQDIEINTKKWKEAITKVTRVEFGNKRKIKTLYQEINTLMDDMVEKVLEYEK